MIFPYLLHLDPRDCHSNRGDRDSASGDGAARCRDPDFRPGNPNPFSASGRIKGRVAIHQAKANWSGWISNPLKVIEQIIYLLFLRRLDDLRTLEEDKSNRLKAPMERRMFPKGKDDTDARFRVHRIGAILYAMASPAQNLPLPKVLLEHLVNEHDRASLRTELAAIASRAVPYPEADSESELELAADMYVVSLRLFKSLGPAATVVLRADINSQLDALMSEEYVATEAMRKLACSHLREAVAVLGRFVERIASTVSDLSPEALTQMLEGLRIDREELVAVLHVDVPSRQMAVTFLAIALGLDSLRGELTELTHWARRAVEASRRVEPLLADLTPSFMGVVTRLRAQHAWANWDQTEVERELNSWKSLDQ